jgi:Mrp family chromosome partitioning ATPase
VPLGAARPDEGAGAPAPVGPANPIPGVVPANIENLWLLPAGGIVRDPTRLLDSAPLAAFMGKVAGQWDVVIFDSAPVGSIADTLAVAALADAVLLIARADRTRRGHVESALEALGKTGSPVLGVVFNDFHPDLFSQFTPYASYYHYDGYGGRDASDGAGRNGQTPAATPVSSQRT